jgi:glutamate racemase
MQHFAEPAGVKVLPVTSLELVPLIEAGQQMTPHCLEVLKQCLTPAVEQGLTVWCWVVHIIHF